MAAKNYEIRYFDTADKLRKLKVPPSLALAIGKLVAEKYCGAVVFGAHAVAAYRGRAEQLDVYWGATVAAEPAPGTGVETYYGAAMGCPSI